jgi:hypothetical protein
MDRVVKNMKRDKGQAGCRILHPAFRFGTQLPHNLL